MILAVPRGYAQFVVTSRFALGGVETLCISILPADVLPTTDDLQVLRELRDGILGIDGLKIGSAPLARAIRPGVAQNAVDWSTIIVSTSVGVPAAVISAVLKDFLVGWTKRHRVAGRSLIIRLGDADVEIRNATDATKDAKP